MAAPTTRLTLAGLAVLVLAGCTSGPAPADDRAPVVHAGEHTVDPGGFVEVNLAMNASAEVSASFEADAPLAWDVHSHDGQRVLVHDNGTAANGTINLQAPEEGVYSLLWENRRDAATTVSVTVRGSATLAGIAP